MLFVSTSSAILLDRVFLSPRDCFGFTLFRHVSFSEDLGLSPHLQ